jgi:hypothetical protein
MVAPSPFKINIPNKELEFLKTKLDSIRLPKISPAGWTEQEGIPLNLMEDMLTHWRISYLPRWRSREEALNMLPMYTLPIDTDEFGSLNIHFIWKKAKNENAIPLLFVHGWPGCFLEVTKLLDSLTEGEENGVVFDVIAPSLPNFGFSDGVGKVRFSTDNDTTLMLIIIERVSYRGICHGVSQTHASSWLFRIRYARRGLG